MSSPTEGQPFRHLILARLLPKKLTLVLLYTVGYNDTKMSGVKGPFFVDAGTVQHVSASYLPTQGRVRLHIKAVEQDKPQDFLLALPDIEPFVTLLLMMGPFRTRDSPDSICERKWLSKGLRRLRCDNLRPSGA